MKNLIFTTLIFIFLLGCGEESENRNIDIETIDKLEENSSKKENILSIISNEIIFGTNKLSRVVNFSDGNFGTIKYSENITADLFNLSFELENIFFKDSENIETSFIFKIDEVKSQKLLIIVFPNINILQDGDINISKMEKLYIYGIRSSGTPISISTPITLIKNTYIYSKDGKIFVDFSKTINQVSKNIGADFSMDSYLNSDKTLVFSFAFSNLNSLEDGKDISEILLDSLKGDIRDNVQSKLVGKKAFGISGLIKIER